MVVNRDLWEERQNCSFDVEELSNFIRGGRENRQKAAEIAKRAENLLKNEISDLNSLSLNDEGRFERDLRILQKFANEKSNDDDLGLIMGGGVLYPEGSCTTVHLFMFIPTIRTQCDEQQKAKWLSKALNFEIFGTYGQTELGHGSNLRGLETTATFDPKTQEFVIHSPSITAYKWWPGGLGTAANHVILMARLILNGKDYGPHPFMVQIRDTETHKAFPGVKVGVIGTTLGYKDANNGFLGFDQFRIPRTNMLMKYSQVTPQGAYVKPPQEKLSYGTMIYVRTNIAGENASRLQKAVTIATRYSAVRRQSELIPGKPEVKIIEYQTQQLKLFPYIAMSYGLQFAAENLLSLYKLNIDRMDKGEFGKLAELHALASCLKAFGAQEHSNGIDVLRRSCGGHGFMASSGLPSLWKIATGACTYEGENTVLYLQTARYLLKQKNNFTSLGSLVTEEAAIENPLFLLKAFSSVVTEKLGILRGKLSALKTRGLDYADAKNACLLEMENLGKEYAKLFIIESFKNTLDRAEDKLAPNTLTLLKRLYEMLSLFWILQNSGDFITFANFQVSYVILPAAPAWSIGQLVLIFWSLIKL